MIKKNNTKTDPGKNPRIIYYYLEVTKLKKSKRKVTIKIEEEGNIIEFIPIDYILIANENDKTMHSICCTNGLDTMESMIGFMDSFRKQLSDKINIANNLIKRAEEFYIKNNVSGFFASMTDQEKELIDIEKIKDIFIINDIEYKMDKDGNKN